ncbi:MAG: hypothetical protein HOP11_10865 [Saprospiraceae bacterium]|nr:hypothetical protein [Saprospiraceae bacterium]
MIRFICLLGFFISINYNLVGQDTIRIEDIFNRKSSKPSIKTNTNETNLDCEKVDEFTKILDDCVYIVESQYHLRKGKNTFGKDGASSFGSKLRIGIGIGDEIWSDPCIRTPWVDDEDFIELDGEYVAENNLLRLTGINNNKIDKIKPESFDFQDSTSKFTKIGFKKFKVNSIGLSLKFNPDGILILYYKNKTDTSLNIEKHAIMCSPTWKDNLGFVKELKDMNIIGGFFLNPTYSTGVATFKLAGIVIDYAADKLIPRRIRPVFDIPVPVSESELLDSEKNKKKASKVKSRITEIKNN